MTRPTATPVYMWFLTWALLFPLLFFSARGMFSFDRSQYANNASVDMASVNASDSDTAYFRIERFTVYAVVIAAMGLSARGTIRVIKRNLSIFILPAIAFLSTLWSQEPVKTASLAILAFCLTAFTVYLVQRFEGDKLIDLFNLVGVAAMLISYLLVFFLPSAGIRNIDASRAWQGMFVHKNTLGVTMVFFFATAYYTNKGTALTQFLYRAYMAGLVVLIAMSQSRTAWVQFFLLICFFLFESLYIRVGKLERGLAAATVAVVSVAMIFIAVNYGGDIAVALGKTSDMTGRAGIFEVLYPELWKRPALGFGYQAFWLGMKGESANVLLTPGHASVANAENGILQMWLELGAAGTVALIFLLLRSSRNVTICLANKPSKFTRWTCAIMFLSLLGVINGDKFMYPDTIEWILFALAYINLAEEVRRSKVKVRVEETRQVAWAS
jgi:exopolysaccharide production protein ExoQ